MDSSGENLVVLKGRQIGYSRRASSDQSHSAQLSALRSAGCDQIYIEHEARQQADWPILDSMLTELQRGDTVIVPRLEMVARSKLHLLGLLETFHANGVAFRSLEERLDTSNAGGVDSVLLIRAIVRLDHTALSERTKAGIEAAKANGRLPGNPQLRARRPEALLSASRARKKTYMTTLRDSAQSWLPLVRELRPIHSWDNVVRVLNHRGQSWTVERLRRAVHHLVQEGLAEQSLLVRSPPRPPEDRILKVVAAIALADPELSLRAIGKRLDELGEPPPRGGRNWQVSSVRHYLDEARRFGLVRR